MVTRTNFISRRTAMKLRQFAITSAGSVKVKLLLCCFCMLFTLIVLASHVPSVMGWNHRTAPPPHRSTGPRSVWLALFVLFRCRCRINYSTIPLLNAQLTLIDESEMESCICFGIKWININCCHNFDILIVMILCWLIFYSWWWFITFESSSWMTLVFPYIHR